MPSHNHRVGDWLEVPYTPEYRGLACRGDTTRNIYSSNSGSTNNHNHSGANTSTSRTSNGISANHTHSVTAKGTIGNTGSGQSFSILPPYTTVYIWKRTA